MRPWRLWHGSHSRCCYTVRERTSRMIQGWAHATRTYITYGQEQQGRHGASFRMESPPIRPLPCRAPCHICSLFLLSSQPAEVMTLPISFLFTQRMRSKCQVLASKASCHLAPVQSLIPPHLLQLRTVIFTSVFCHQALLKAPGMEGRGTRFLPPDDTHHGESEVDKGTRNMCDWNYCKDLKGTIYQHHVLV